MKNRTHSISRIIDSNADSLFQIVSDFKNYHKWNTVIPKAEGKLIKGSTLKLTMNMNGKKRPFNPNVVSIEPEKKFTLSKVILFRGIGELFHDFEFIPLNNNKTEFKQTWTGKGWLVNGLWSKISTGFASFETFNDDLEQYIKQ